MKIQDIDLNFDKYPDGLVPAVVQDAVSAKVLMVGFMNQEAVQATFEKGKVTFFSRSKQRLWTKGETSGNFLELESFHVDCDNDTILVQVNPVGPACHTGAETCFFQPGEPVPAATDYSFLHRLEQTLKGRKENPKEGSYTSKMFAKGLDKITQKVGEEAVETVIASKNDDEGEFVYEASDLLFHLTLLMVEKEIPLKRLVQELERRHQ